jgi:biopolymer transport protein ExbD
MKHVLALAVALAACTSSSKAPRPDVPSTTKGRDGELLGSEDCDGLVILTVTPTSIEVDRVARSVPKHGGTIAAAALKAELEPADPKAACAKAVSITARGDVTYQELVAVMDIAIASGRTDVSLFGRQENGYPTRRRLQQPTDDEFMAALAKDPFDPAVVPITLISTTEIELRWKGEKIIIDDRAPLGDESAMQGLQEQLREARSTESPAAGGVVVLQADRSTPAQLVIETSNAMRAAGYHSILFAVQTGAGGTP